MYKFVKKKVETGAPLVSPTTVIALGGEKKSLFKEENICPHPSGCGIKNQFQAPSYTIYHTATIVKSFQRNLP